MYILRPHLLFGIIALPIHRLKVQGLKIYIMERAHVKELHPGQESWIQALRKAARSAFWTKVVRNLVCGERVCLQ